MTHNWGIQGDTRNVMCGLSTKSKGPLWCERTALQRKRPEEGQFIPASKL